MPRAERSRARLAAWGVLALLAALALIPGYLTVPPDWRPVVVRLACAFLVIVGSTRIIGRVRRSIEGEARSPLDPARRPARRPVLDERFTRVRDDVVFSTRSRRYFETILWPRLRKLGATELPPPERRPLGRRGPSLRTLERVVAGIERRP
jgi:hypothetical protein